MRDQWIKYWSKNRRHKEDASFHKVLIALHTRRRSLMPEGCMPVVPWSPDWSMLSGWCMPHRDKEQTHFNAVRNHWPQSFGGLGYVFALCALKADYHTCLHNLGRVRTTICTYDSLPHTVAQGFFGGEESGRFSGSPRAVAGASVMRHFWEKGSAP